MNTILCFFQVVVFLTAPSVTSISTQQKDHPFGAWYYTEQYCSAQDTTSMEVDFIIDIQPHQLTLGSNAVLCNAMWSSCRVSETQIIFTRSKNHSPTFTELECPPSNLWLCPSQKRVATMDVFFDMDYEVNGDVLTLTSTHGGSMQLLRYKE